MEDFVSVWNEIATEARGEPGWHVRRISSRSHGTIYVGLKQPGSIKGLLFEVAASSVPTTFEMPSGTGFRTELVPLTTGPDGKVRLALELVNALHDEVFTSLCEDVASLVSDQPDEGSGVRTFLQRLHSWQKFMRAQGRQGMSRESVQGLFSEISFLHSFILPNLSGGQALATWKGANALHDFASGNDVIEVKSSTVSSDPVVRIANFDQLNEDLVGTLLVCFVSLREDHDAGRNLPSLIDLVRGTLENDAGALRQFEDRILEAGYHDSARDLYTLPVFNVDQFRFFEVRDDFPRLKSEELRSGIVSGQYSIRINDCQNYEVTSERFVTVLTGRSNAC